MSGQGSDGNGGDGDGGGEGRARPVRADFPHFTDVPTRWMDDDVYGHVNNVTYYSYFDTVVNRYGIERGGFDPHAAPVIGLVVESGCRYHRPLGFPDLVQAGLRVDHLGRSSVRYALGLFRAGEAEIAAEGHFVHVYVDRATRRPAPIPDPLRAAMAALRRA